LDENKRADADQYELYSWGLGNYGCLFHGSENDEGLPRKVNHFDVNLDLRTFQLERNYSSFIFDFEGRIYSFGLAIVEYWVMGIKTIRTCQSG